MGKVLIWFVIIISTVVLYCLMKVNLAKCQCVAEQNNKLFSDVDMLTNAMRIYLKIEWNRTKERKDN